MPNLLKNSLGIKFKSIMKSTEQVVNKDNDEMSSSASSRIVNL